MRPWHRRFLLLLAAAALCLAIAWPFVHPSAIPVEVGRVVRAPLASTLEEDGVTRVHPRTVVAAPVAGRPAALRLDPGDAVRAGDVVAVLTPTPLDPRARQQGEAFLRAERAAKAAADAGAAEAATVLEQTRRTLARSERLAEAGQVATEELERARTAARAQAKLLEAARFRAGAAAWAVKNAEAALVQGDGDAGSAIALRAPASGRVLRLIEDSERVVPAGAPIVELGDLGTLEVVVDVLSTDAVSIPVGARMLLDAGSGAAFSARVARVEPAAFRKVSPLGVEEQRVNVVGELTEPAPGVGDAYRVRATIVLWQSEAVLQVPMGAIFRAGTGWEVFTVEHGRARRRAVEIGHRGALGAELLDGLALDAAVVLYPDSNLTDGARIEALSPGR